MRPKDPPSWSGFHGGCMAPSFSTMYLSVLAFLVDVNQPVTPDCTQK